MAVGKDFSFFLFFHFVALHGKLKRKSSFYFVRQVESFMVNNKFIELKWENGRRKKA